MPGRVDLTEQYPCPFPLVYGYIRLARPGAARRQALESVVATYCDQHELRLCGVFTERPPVSGVRSSAFAGLLDVLALPGVYGVVIPSDLHLGRDILAADRRERVLTAGARLLVIRRHHGGRPFTSHSHNQRKEAKE